MSIAPAGEPSTWPLVPEFFPRNGISPRDGVIDLLFEAEIARNNGNAIRRIAELEIVDGAGTNGLAQAGSRNSARLVPRLVNHAERVAAPAKTGGGGSKGPGVLGVLQHQSEGFRQIDVAAGILFPPRRGVIERLRPVQVRAWIGEGRRGILGH